MGADFYFFTDTNLLSGQPGAFGPVTPASVANTDEYCVTSLHTATSNPTAYAACDAIVCVQAVTGMPGIVNIVLKPLVQPALNFAPVKYIIYTGVLANTLIDPNGIDVAPPGNNDLTKFVWDEQAKRNASVTPAATATAPASALGTGLTGSNFADTDPIDNLFYRAGVAFQLPVVKGGWSLGQFAQGRFGIEVLMEGLNFHHPLSLARKLEHVISVPALAATATDAGKFEHWHAKEQILGFMDPCAFYGSFFRAGVQARTSTGPFVKKSGNPLYQDVLLNFQNRNTAYLDIRNEHNFSFNYFGNYNGVVQVGNPPVPVDYYDSGWPILTLTDANFAPNNTTKARNAFQLRLEEGDNLKPLIYVSQGYRELRTRGNKFPQELTSAERFFDAFLPFGTGFATPKAGSGPDSLTFAVPNVTGLGATRTVSCYIRIKYLKQQQGVAPEPTVIKAQNYLDNLIWPIDPGILFEGTAPVKSAVYDEEIYVNAQDVDGLRFDGIANIGIARDADNISLFLVPTSIRRHKGLASKLVALSGEASDYSGHYPELVALKYPRERVLRSDLNLSATQTVPVADFVADGWFARFLGPDFSKLIVIVVSGATYTAWKNRIAAGGGLDNRFRTYLGIKNLQTQSDTDGIRYTSFELVLRGFALAASGASYEVHEIGTDPLNNAANVTVYAHAGA